MKLLRSLARCAITFLSLPFLGLGFLWILVDRQRRTWQDIGARTIVVYSFGRPERPVPMPGAERQPVHRQAHAGDALRR